MELDAAISSDSEEEGSIVTLKLDDDDALKDGEIVQFTHFDDENVYVRPVKFDAEFDLMMKQMNERASYR